MHHAWEINDILTCILDAVEAEGAHRKSCLAALAATCKAVYEQPMDRLWVDMTVFDLVSSMPHDSCPVQRAKNVTGLAKGFVLKGSSSGSDWAALTKHAHRIRRLTFRASIALDAEVLASIGKFLLSSGAAGNTPVFPNLHSLTTDYFISGNIFRTWACVPALVAGGRLNELNLALPIHITDQYASLRLDECLSDVFEANPALYRVSCVYTVISSIGSHNDVQNPSSNILDGTLISQVLESAIPFERLHEVHFQNLPTSWPTITSLAASPELATLEIRLPATGPIDLAPGSSFRNLSILRLVFPDDRPFADCLTFLEAIETTSLNELKFSCTTAWQDPPIVRKFFEVLSRQQSLTVFSLFVASSSIQTHWQISATVYQQEYDLMHILNPMLSLKRLRVFHLQGSFRLDIDARHLGIIVSALPCLQTLIILPHLPTTESEVDAGLQASGYPRLPSFRALETIAKYATQLKDLRIVMDNSNHLESAYVEGLKEETFDSRLECLVVPMPAVWQQPDPDAVADFLHILFPGLTYAHFHDRRMVDGYRFDPNSSSQFDLPHTRWNASLISRLSTWAAQ